MNILADRQKGAVFFAVGWMLAGVFLFARTKARRFCPTAFPRRPMQMQLERKLPQQHLPPQNRMSGSRSRYGRGFFC